MSLYDYLGEYKVKCFYDVDFYKPNYEIKDDSSGLYILGGSLKSYNKMDELPLKTTYYNYPDNMMIFDCRGGKSIVHFIEDRKYIQSKYLEEIKDEDIKDYVIDVTGEHTLKISNPMDFSKIESEWKEIFIKFDELKKEYFPNGEVELFMKNINKYNETLQLYSKEKDSIFKAFKERWFHKDFHKEEKLFGQYIHTLKNAYWEFKLEEDIFKKEDNLNALKCIYNEFLLFEKNHILIAHRFLKYFSHIDSFYINNIINLVRNAIN